MNWLLYSVPVAALVLVIVAILRRRVELGRHASNLAERSVAKARGSDKARLQHPKIDLAACIGCGACVRACPEDGVLAMAFGQAVIVHGARCVGHGLCAAACPTAAIALTLGDISDRRDLPAVDENLEAVGVPGLFLAGEITGFALVRTAVKHGALVAQQVAARAAAAGPAPKGGPIDLLVVGLGPAGLACMLGAKERGLRILGVDQAAEVGGTVAAYPRKKLVMTQPMDLPLHGRLGRLEYTKEELVELWQSLTVEHDLPVKTGVVMQKLEHNGDHFAVTTNRGLVRARNVCLAVGRRGSPQKLGVPGEDLPHVAYSLLDAESYHGRAVLVVGGGDSAIEAAMALADQGDNEVTISYRRVAFSRLKARNETRITDAVAAGKVRVLFETTVEAITPEGVRLKCTAERTEPESATGGVALAVQEVPATDVFVFAGGTPPFPLLESAGVSFDPALRPAEEIATDRGTGILVALVGTLVGTLALLAHRILLRDYYDLPAATRAASSWHEVLRPQGFLGLLAGLAAIGLFAVNLAYLARRSPRFGRWLPGSLKGWMNMHVATGIGALLFAALHSGFLLRDSAGGHAFLTMLVVVLAGVVGRWFYSFVPRAQNGRQQDFEELNSQVTAIAGEWDRSGRGFGSEVRTMVERMVETAQFGNGFFARISGLLRSELRLRREMGRLRARASSEGIPAHEAAHVLNLARRSHRLAMQLSHFEEVRGLLSTWRWLHRWFALLLGLLTAAHVYAAMRYGGVDFGVLGGGGG